MADTSFATFRSPELSVFQSALDEVLAGTATPQQPGGAGAGAGNLGLGAAGGGGAPAARQKTPDQTAASPLMQAFVVGAAALAPDAAKPREVEDRGASAPAARGAGSATGPGLGFSVGSVQECARLALELARAKERGDEAEANRLRGLIETGTCDARFIDTITIYLKFRAGLGKIPYRRHQKLTDFVLPMPDKARIAIIGDWGTGLEPARALLKAVAAHSPAPTILFHLGDVYYSCTPREADERFLRIVDATFPNRRKDGRLKVYTLCGNHDVYSGGAGYYGLLNAIGQPASYFCLRNASWQILAMDTGLHDANPLPGAPRITRLEQSEADWHLDKIRNAGGRKTIATSHHQLFTIEKPLSKTADGRQSGLNVKLYAQFRDELAKIALWLWGHEHNFVAYEPFPTGGGRTPLQRGRCLGASAVPVRSTEAVYDVNPALGDAPKMRPERMKKGPTAWAHSYAILDLDGPKGSIEYFQIPHEGGTASSFFKETLG